MATPRVTFNPDTNMEDASLARALYQDAIPTGPELRQQTQPTTSHPPASEKYYTEFGGFKSRPLTDRPLRENST
ncbi:hypothetical protein LZL87_012157 [Fusarium oxysporum]|nr:hypothetical protein LZL87_012157 [Fusarium oxysporum]